MKLKIARVNHMLHFCDVKIIEELYRLSTKVCRWECITRDKKVYVTLHNDDITVHIDCDDNIRTLAGDYLVEELRAKRTEFGYSFAIYRRYL